MAKTTASIACVVAMILVTSTVSAALFQNGSFESYTGNTNDGFATDRNPLGIVGWVATAGPAPAGVLRTDWGTYQMFGGPPNYNAILMRWVYPGSIEQTFDTNAGHQYQVDFMMAGEFGGSDPMRYLTATAEGVTQTFAFDTTGKSSSNMGWASKSLTFTANSAQSTLAFSCAYNPAPIIDQVSVTDMGVAVLPTIYYYDVTFASGLTPAQRYDVYHTTVCLQGLVNRAAPRFFIKYWPYGDGGGDQQWLNRLGETGGMCQGWPVHTILNATELFNTFGAYVTGLVVYDSDSITGVASTSLVATTAAACENAIAIRKDTTAGSMYNWLVNTKHYPVLIDLTGKFTGTGTIWQTSTPSTGSAKCDAYIWAKEKYLDTGRCDPTILSYSLDLYGLRPGFDHYTNLSNLDYAVSKKGFCFELSPWGDEVASDDRTQPLGTDLNTYKQILNACNLRTGGSKMIKVCGFLNWDLKYTNAAGVGGIHGPVDTEWEMIRIQSAYNAYGEPDAPDPRCFANASFYAGLMPAFRDRRYVQNPPPTYADMVARGLIDGGGNIVAGNYILLGMGDYDAPCWTMYNMLNCYYNDATRGQRYCTWAVNPNLVDRMSAGFDYMFRHKTSKDYFVAWDSGAGYIWPQQLYGTRSPSGYASAVPVWQAHCKDYYRQLDYSISGWLLNGSYQLTTTDYQNYALFSGDGIGSYLAASATNLVNNVPCNRMKGDLGIPNPNATVMDYASGVNFGWYRTIVWTPTDIKNLEDKYANSGHNHRFLDAYTYYYLLRYSLSGRQQSSNYYRTTWTSDTIPRIMAAGHTYPVTVTVRNDGWDTWSEASFYRSCHAIVASGVVPVYADYDTNGRHFLPSNVVPGQSMTFSFNLTAPASVGNYDLCYDIVKDGYTWFREQNNIEWKKQIIVAVNEMDIDTDGDGIPDVTEQANGTLYWHPADGYAFGPSTPGTPADIGAYTNSSTITFNWTASTDSRYSVAGYNCQIGTTPGGTDVFNGYLGSVPSRTISGCLNGKTYYCRVQAVNNAGYLSRWSGISDGILVDTTAPTAPGTPTDAGVYTQSTSVTFNWTASSDTGSGIVGYNCQIGTTPGGADVFSGYVGNLLSKLVTGCLNGSTYYCRLQAKDNAGNLSSWSGSSNGITVVTNAGVSIAAARHLPDSATVGLSGKVVTGIFGDCLYIEEPGRTAGIRVIVSTVPSGIVIGSMVDVGGTLMTNASRERYIVAGAIETGVAH